jgi:hypothetical protein
MTDFLVPDYERSGAPWTLLRQRQHERSHTIRTAAHPERSEQKTMTNALAIFLAKAEFL